MGEVTITIYVKSEAARDEMITLRIQSDDYSPREKKMT
jgi:hypothetical protein